MEDQRQRDGDRDPLMPRAFVIFCDDVRTEITGKDILIGIYQRVLYAHRAVADQPPRVQVRLYITIDEVKLQPSRETEVEMTLRIIPEVGGGEHELASGTFHVKISRDENTDGHVGEDRLVLVPPSVSFHLEEDGRLEVNLAVDGAPCEVIGGINVRVRDLPISP